MVITHDVFVLGLLPRQLAHELSAEKGKDKSLMMSQREKNGEDYMLVKSDYYCVR